MGPVNLSSLFIEVRVNTLGEMADHQKLQVHQFVGGNGQWSYLSMLLLSP
jgi:hypothetical protein